MPKNAVDRLHLVTRATKAFSSRQGPRRRRTTRPTCGRMVLVCARSQSRTAARLRCSEQGMREFGCWLVRSRIDAPSDRPTCTDIHVVNDVRCSQPHFSKWPYITSFAITSSKIFLIGVKQIYNNYCVPIRIDFRGYSIN